MPPLKIFNVRAFSPELQTICMVLKIYNPFFLGTSTPRLPSEGRSTIVSRR